MREIAIEVVIKNAMMTRVDPMDASVMYSSVESGGRPVQIQSLRDLFSSVKRLGKP